MKSPGLMMNVPADGRFKYENEMHETTELKAIMTINIITPPTHDMRQPVGRWR